MNNTNQSNQVTHTVAGTDIEAVKRENEQSGMSYNEAKEFLARTSGGHGTSVYSDTNIEAVKKKNQTKQKE
ncbi:gamma-type small acid-soluble spore protein [Oceanobacillus rekensis]|uniref:gamma-type small acid-soluble spore protein n=1 Tax=Oceanobacillus rekensis TaxID=937927 RepID=UPI000B43342B|nr:gamma-type small acid-soluble spore protein [Oceanobacillus rekensis]